VVTVRKGCGGRKVSPSGRLCVSPLGTTTKRLKEGTIMNLNTLADLLLFASLIGLITGLIKPKIFQKITQGTHQRKKIGLLGGLGILLSLILLFINAPTTPSNTSSADKTNTNDPVSIIKTAIAKDLSDTTDTGKKKFRSVDVATQEGGGYGVFAEYNADEVGSADSQRTILTEDATQLYKTIYSQTHQDVRTASVSAYFAGSDQYGNASDKLVYKTILNKDVASKINWSADNATLELKLPSLWSVTVKDF